MRDSLGNCCAETGKHGHKSMMHEVHHILFGTWRALNCFHGAVHQGCLKGQFGGFLQAYLVVRPEP